MKIVIVNKSDTTGGAAVVSRRLMESLRGAGVDARMLVVEKLSDSPYVEKAASEWESAVPFLAERLGIFCANGFRRDTLFSVDTASSGLPLWRHPLVKGADAVILNWVNQGMLSLKGVSRIVESGVPVIWTMHDMWCFTGICHHAGECRRFRTECGECSFLGKRRGREDLSNSVWKKKNRLPHGIKYVAVSNWLRNLAEESPLLKGKDLTVIPNAFPIQEGVLMPRVPKGKEAKIRILFGAARLDDPVKGLPALVEASCHLRRDNPGLADRLELVTFGSVRNPGAFDGMAIECRHLGVVCGEDEVRGVYESADILVSASRYETLPGTLVEAQAYGCIPVSFNRGGQRDIVEHGVTGWLGERPDNDVDAGMILARGIEWAVSVIGNPEEYNRMEERMRMNVAERFSPAVVASEYLRLING